VSTPPLAYVDTNIFISYALGEEKSDDFQIVEKFFEEVSKGKYVVLVSNFVLSETLHALRRIKTEEALKETRNGVTRQELRNIVNSAEFRKAINDKSYEAFKVIIGFITSDPDHFKLADLKTNYSEEMFSQALRTLSGCLGEFRVYPIDCPKCDAELDCTQCGVDCKIVYKSFNAPDLTHLLMSTSLGCKYLFTMDKGFSKIPRSQSQSEIKVLSQEA